MLSQHSGVVNRDVLRSRVHWCNPCNMSIDTDWFKDLMAARRISQRQLAKQLGVDHSALSLTFRGKREMKMTEAADLARLLGVPVADVMEHAGIQGDTRTVPLRGWIDGLCETHLEESSDRVPAPHGMAEGAFALQYRTSGTPLDYKDGWIAFIQKPLDEVPAEAIGQFCLVKLTDGIQMVGTLKRGYKKGRWNITNAVSTIHDVDVDWAAPIAFIQTK